MKADLLIKNARILTVADETVFSGHCLVKDGVIQDIFTDTPPSSQAETVLDAREKLLIPGFVDCHTHLVHAGERSGELALRLRGSSYQEIQAAGGGIHASVRATRGASEDELFSVSRKRAEICLRHGTTTAEIKSGYGLEAETEEKMLRVIRRLGDETPLDTVPTFLGAHVYPQDTDPEAYLNWLITGGLDLAEKYAAAVDIYCDTGAFSYNDTKIFLRAAVKRKLKLRIHSGQFTAAGATGLAADLQAVSADHLDHVSENEFLKLKASGTVPVFLPGCSYYLKTVYPDARRFLDAGLPVALATDYNPGTCPCLSLPMIMSLAVMNMGMTPFEALKAVTLHAAQAICRENTLGSIEKGKQADLLLLQAANIDELPAHFGTNLIDTVIKNGHILS